MDKYLLQATTLSEEKKYMVALAAMDRIVGLQEEHNLTLPKDFAYRYAKTALAAGSVQAAIDSATRYLSAAGREGKYYREALELLVTAERELQEAGADQMAESKKGKTPLQVASTRNRKVLRNAWARLSDRQKAAYQARVRRKKATAGPSFLDVAVGVAGGAAIATAGGGTEAALDAGTMFAESVISGSQPGVSSGGGSVSSTENSRNAEGRAPCQVPSYPNPPGGVANLGFSWCPASVGMQVRAFALQAAGAQCAIATGSSSTPEQIEARRREIRAACNRLAALGQRNCQCPPDLRQ